ncbi:polyprenol reductase [Oryzias melastigma]|uniref:Polyprenal reductase n=1 Tax=Oryzias melastigma TaxID=30732 RepID=A0A3B3CA76_ORYME|nr:polyprenol reductase [Oryzias melastigma]
MSWGFLNWSLIDVLWFTLALCFLLAFCIHKISGNNHESLNFFLIFQDLIRYGKTKNLKRTSWLRMFDVPKRWFWHFYIVSVCWNGCLLFLNMNSIHHRQSYPSWLTGILDVLSGAPSPDSPVPQLSTVLVQLLVWVHSLRRLLECLFVSVFSDGVMHVVQYGFGLVYYVALGLTVLCVDRIGKGASSLSQLGWIQTTGFIVFICGSLLQHQSIVLLARLRTGKSGAVETLAHRMPTGGCFHLVSCPHYFAELLIYVSLGFVFGGRSSTWWLLVLYVFFNQALAAQLSHELYVSKYQLYPKHRKALIPFVL